MAALVYGGLWSLMNVAYLAYWFPLPFLEGLPFYRRYARTVGGPIQYLANLFTQTYSRHWAGVLAFTLLALAAWAIARGILRRFAAGRWNGLAAAFPIVILTLANRSLAVLFILPMVAGLAIAWLYISLSERASVGWPRSTLLVLGVVVSFLLYWMLASGFLYVCVMCALFVALVRRQWLRGLAWLAVGAIVPFAVSRVLFEPSALEWYLRWMTLPQRDGMSLGLGVAMYLFVPLGAVIAFMFARYGAHVLQAPRVRLAGRVAGYAVLVLLAAQLVAMRYDTSGWVYADFLRDEGRPEAALASLSGLQDDSDQARFITLFSLAETGRLPWDMFRYPQRASSDALLLRDTAWDTNPAVAHWRSDLYLELGRVNDSQRWAHEALAIEGETPRVLERMAVTYILGDNPDAAKTFVRALGKIPFQETRARQYLEALDRDAGMKSDPLMARIRPLMLRRDHVGVFTTEQILQQCLEANPSNKMAFEYLLAHYLLMSDMNGLAAIAPRFKAFYSELPTHVQEALLGYKNVNGSFPPGIDASAIRSLTAARFQSFIQTWSRLQGGSPEAMWNALAPDYGDTWWFFFVFGRTVAGPPPLTKANASQQTVAP